MAVKQEISIKSVDECWLLTSSFQRKRTVLYVKIDLKWIGDNDDHSLELVSLRSSSRRMTEFYLAWHMPSAIIKAASAVDDDSGGAELGYIANLETCLFVAVKHGNHIELSVFAEPPSTFRFAYAVEFDLIAVLALAVQLDSAFAETARLFI